jgi:hypothetical protein
MKLIVYIVLIILILWGSGSLIKMRNWRKLNMAQDQYEATKICPHTTTRNWKFYTVGNTAASFLIGSFRWCKVCGKSIGPPKPTTLMKKIIDFILGLIILVVFLALTYFYFNLPW